jgi:outer membrane lipoprotein-sorting protein
MNCSTCQDLLAAYLENLLDQADSAAFETHKNNCSTCHSELHAARQIFDRLLADARSISVASLEEPVMDRILHEQTVPFRSSSTKRMLRKIVVAAAVLLCVAFGVEYLTSVRNRPAAYAEEIAAARQQLEAARTIAWIQTLFAKTSSDGNATWVDVTSKRWFYKDPGLVRIEHFDADTKETTSVEIWDEPKGKRLSYDLRTKKAILYVDDKPNVDGPVDWSPLGWAIAEMRGDLQWLGSKQIGDRKANGFRTANINTSFGDVSYNADFWIDAETKQLLVVQRPGEDKMNELKSYRRSLHPGMRDHDIKFGVKLDDSLFSIDPPEGFALETIAPPEITEKELIEWLGIAAQMNDSSFPDSVIPLAVSTEKLHRIMNAKAPESLTPLEKKIRERFDLGDRVHFHPIRRFVSHTGGDSWVYLGKGVKLGEKERIVCWYKPADAKTYRVVYGDLSVKNVAAADLPLNVEP